MHALTKTLTLMTAKSVHLTAFVRALPATLSILSLVLWAEALACINDMVDMYH